MTDVVSPPCLHDSRPLPPRNTRVRNVITGSLGTVHRPVPARGRLFVLRDGAMFAAEYYAGDWEPVEDNRDEDEDDGFAEHDADDALHDARREEALS